MHSEQKDKISSMKQGGKVLAKMLSVLKSKIKPGLDIWSLELDFRLMCKQMNAIPACLGYQASSYPHFPTGLCVGINSDSVHCYPQKGKTVKQGDIISVDAVIKYNGYHVDSAFTIGVGQIKPERQRFLDTAELALKTAIKQVKPGNKIGDVSNAIQTIAELSGYNVLRNFTGHSIGKYMHQAPYIPCFGEKNTGQTLENGMALAIEALLSSGGPEVIHVTTNDWQTKIADNSDFAIFEQTVVVTADGNIVLT